MKERDATTFGNLFAIAMVEQNSCGVYLKGCYTHRVYKKKQLGRSF